jgi:hypothetical protein
VTDRQYIIEQMENKLLFPAETDAPTRERLKARILSIKTLIPTLKTYSWDTLHLRELGTILRLLLSADDFKDGPRNIRSALRDIWEEPETGSAVLVEDLEDGVFSKLTVTSRTVDIFEVQLQSLVLHVMRNYTKLGSFSPKTISGETKVQPEKPTITDLHRFAETARTLGFRSVQYIMTPNEALRQDCENFVKKLKPRDLWEYDIANVVDGHCRVQHGLRTKSQVNEVQDDLEVRLSQRFGRPITSVLDGSARNLFLRHLSSAVTETSGVTSTFVRVEFFRRFWDPVRIEVGDFSDVGMVKISGLEGETLETSSTYSDDGIADEWRLREEQENRSVREDLQAAHDQIERQKEQIDQYTSEMSQSRKELGELRKDSENKSAHIDKLELQAKADKDMITKLSERNENIRSGKEEMHLKRIEELEHQTSTLRDERRKEEQGAQAVTTQKETEIEGLRNRLNEAEFLAGEENKKLRENLQSQAEQLQEVQKELYSKNEQLQAVQKELHSKNEQLQALQKELHSKNEQLQALQKEELKLRAVRNQAVEKQTEIEGLNNRLKEAEVRSREETQILREELATKTEQLKLMQKSLTIEEVRGQEQASLLKQSAEAAIEKTEQGNLENLIEKYKREIDEANFQIKSIDEQIGSISTMISAMSKTKKNPSYSAAQGKMIKGKQNEKLTQKQNEKLELEKSRLSSEEKLTNARYDLLGLRGVEALVYERDPVTKEFSSQIPARVPLNDLYAKFKDLKKDSDQYRVWYENRGFPVILSFNNFHEWQKRLAAPPAINDAKFYVENLSPKRKAANEKFTASKRFKA